MSTVKGPAVYVPVDPAYLTRLETIATLATVLTLATGPTKAGRVSVSRRAVDELIAALHELHPPQEASADTQVRSKQP